MFGNLGFGELMVIMVIVLVLFGAKRVPEISASFGKGIREFKRNLNDVESSIVDARDDRSVAAPRPLDDDAGQHVVNPDDARVEPKRLL